MRPPVEIGRIVVARAGRDAGDRFIIVGLPDEDYALLCNGRNRTWQKPKKKKRMHIRPTRYMSEEIRDRILSGEHIMDSDIRKALEAVDATVVDSTVIDATAIGPAEEV